MNITESLHPHFSHKALHWRKWRLTYEGGDSFINAYLQRYSKREDNFDFHKRKAISYCPAFAKTPLVEIKNAIFQRIFDVVRAGGSKSYNDAMLGLNGGVDRTGSTMNSFIGTKILTELLPMSKVGIFVDMPSLPGPTLADKGDKKPYIYSYCAEQIKNWAYSAEYPDRLVAICLEDNSYQMDDFGLIQTIVTRYRRLWIDDNEILWVQFYDTVGKGEEPINLGRRKRIPFVIFELPESLLNDAANYQIALLNLESSDLFYALRSNFPFYTEQYDPRSESGYLKSPGESVSIVQAGNEETVTEIKVGMAAGRRYPINLERPGFIHPSSEPLKASMEKGKQIKEDMRALVNLSLSSLTEKGTEESGLAYIGLELQRGEKQIAEIWAEYEGGTASTVTYPTNYSLKSEEDRQKEVTYYQELIPKLPSKTYQKEVAKTIAEISLGHKISIETLEKIKKEIDAAEVIVSDPNIIKTDLENGLVGNKLASKIRGYPEGQVDLAEQDHINRATRIAISQTQGMAAEARGVPDLGANSKGASQEKTVSRDTTTDNTVTSKVRGQGQ